MVDQVLAHAYRYATAGWPVFPVRGKVPAVPSAHPKGDPLHGRCEGGCGRPGHGVYDATIDPEQLAELWQAAGSGVTGVAWAMGVQPDGTRLVAIDIDPRNGGDLRALGIDTRQVRTPTARTGGDGWHVVYQVPASAVLASTIDGVDLKADGGYIVVEPSRHPDTGRRYRWLPGLSPLDVAPAPMPVALLERLTRPVAAGGRGTGHKAGKSACGGHPAAPALSTAFVAILGALGIMADAGDGNHLVPCVFHHDEHPSLSIDPSRAVFYCHAPTCPAHGGGGMRELAELARRHHGVVVDTSAVIGGDTGTTDAEALQRAMAVDRLVHDHVGHTAGTCPVCGRFVLEQHTDGDTVHGRARPTFCHRRECQHWQSERIRRKLRTARFGTWGTWFVAEVADGDDYNRLRDGVLYDHDHWIGAPTEHGTVLVVASVPFPGAVRLDGLAGAVGIITDAMQTIPAGKRLRTVKPAARRKRRGTTDAETEPAPAPPERKTWLRGGLGIDLLRPMDVPAVQRMIEEHGGQVQRRARGWTYTIPVVAYATIVGAVERWQKTRGQRAHHGREISAYDEPGDYASISPAVVVAAAHDGTYNPAAVEFARRLAVLERAELVKA